jgi:tetratricopeptide (TPR) repeat protein
MSATPVSVSAAISQSAQAQLLQQAVCDAMRQASARLDAAERQAEPFEMSQALTQVARCYRAMQLLPSAEASLVLAQRWCRLTGSTDALVDLTCELSEAAVALAQQQERQEPGTGHAALERARDGAFEVSTLAGRVADPGWEAQVLLRASDVLNHCGDRDDAAQLQTRALRLMSGSLAAGGADPALLPTLGRLADG